MKSFLIITLFLFSAANARANTVENSARSLVHLLDYLAQDYGEAVSKGRIINVPEYKEQIEFCDSAIDTNNKLPENRRTHEITAKLHQLKALIAGKASHESVAQMAQEIKSEVVRVSRIEVA